MIRHERDLNQGDLVWIDIQLALATHEINEKFRKSQMSVEVKGLADTVRAAREAIGKASSAASRMSDSAGRVVERVSQVEDMIKQLDAAEADLTAAMATMSNGGPAGPLPDMPTSAPVAPASSVVLNEAGVVPEAK